MSNQGIVKWFNNKAGFGFITGLDGEKSGEDIFVHHSGVMVASEQYKYLVQGEYVSFELKASDNKDHPWQASKVKGILGGNLMCETRNENKREDDGRQRGEGKPRGERNGERRQERRGEKRRENESNEQSFELQ